jgi:hypothetical protein
MSFKKPISIDVARRLAWEQARSLLLDYVEFDSQVDILEERFAESEECWMFFINKNLRFPPEATFPASAAYAVSKRGEVRTIADFSDNPPEMKKLLALLSEHFRVAHVKKKHEH